MRNHAQKETKIFILNPRVVRTKTPSVKKQKSTKIIFGFFLSPVFSLLNHCHIFCCIDAAASYGGGSFLPPVFFFYLQNNLLTQPVFSTTFCLIFFPDYSSHRWGRCLFVADDGAAPPPLSLLLLFSIFNWPILRSQQAQIPLNN